MQSFYNTISLSGPELKQAVANAEKQEEAIYLIFQSGRKMTASQVHRITEKAGHQWPIWSVRRGVTNLKKSGLIMKMDEMKKGPQGVREHYYLINQRTA